MTAITKVHAEPGNNDFVWTVPLAGPNDVIVFLGHGAEKRAKEHASKMAPLETAPAKR